VEDLELKIFVWFKPMLTRTKKNTFLAWLYFAEMSQLQAEDEGEDELEVETVERHKFLRV